MSFVRYLMPRGAVLAAVPRGGVCSASCLASGVRRVGSLAEMRRVQVACSLVVACGPVAARAHSSHVAGTAHVSGLRRAAVRAGAVERFGRGSLPLLRLRGGNEQFFIKTTSYPDLKPNPALESTIHLVFRLRGGEDAEPVQSRRRRRLARRLLAASWSLMMHISPEHVPDAALAVLFFAVTIGLLHWADLRLQVPNPMFSRYLFFLLSSPVLFFAGRVPPPFPAFVLCSSYAFIGGIAVGVVVYIVLFFEAKMGIGGPGEDISPGPIFGVLWFAGVLVLTVPFFVPTFGLAADGFWLFQTLGLAILGLFSVRLGFSVPLILMALESSFSSSGGYGVALQSLAPWLLGHGCLYGIAYGMALVASNLRRVVRMLLNELLKR